MNYDRCWNFIRYAMSEETQRYLAERKLNLPSRIGIPHGNLTKKQSDLMSRYLEHCERRVEDYYMPAPSAFVMEVGIDRWIKHGTEFSSSVVKEIEKSCQWYIDNLAWK